MPVKHSGHWFLHQQNRELDLESSPRSLLALQCVGSKEPFFNSMGTVSLGKES